MKKPIVTEITEVVSGKRAARLTSAKLVLKRADREIAVKPHASATLIIRDMRAAMNDLIDEVEFIGR